jgi:hypothetical protein
LDAKHFDRLARALSERGPRRGLLGLLATLPVLGGLFALLDADETDAKGRRKRRKKRHKHGKGRHKGRRHKRKKPKKPCKPQTITTTCAGGKCGPVQNNCKKTVDCGSCACTPPCEECFTCQGAEGVPGTCVPRQAATPCGTATFCSDGTLFPQGECDGDGNCVSSLEAPCEPYQCAGDQCATTCSSAADCFDGYFCDNDDHCVAEGDNGDPCAEDGQCASGHCVDDVCCQTACDGACQVCDASGDGACTTVADGGACGDDAICCAGDCVGGVCCEDAMCSAAAPDCEGHECTCDGGAACAGDPELCCAGDCVNTDTDPAHCGSCGGGPCSGATPRCWNGACVCGDVCAEGCQFTSVQAAIDALPAGTTVRICAGTYGAITIGKDLTLIGAGDGSAPASNTILDAAQQGRVVDVNSGVTATVQGLRITGGSANVCAGVRNRGSLTMTGCTVTGNAATMTNGGGGGMCMEGSLLTMTDCTVSHNTAHNANGGGIAAFGALTMTNCTLSHNSASGGFGGGLYLTNHATIQLFGCTIGPENTASNGGGIMAFNDANVTLDDTDVTGNSASGNVRLVAGGIYNPLSTVTLQNGSTVTGNTPRNCDGPIEVGTCGP